MPSPFPGMDPYLEHPALWPGVHNHLIVALAEHLTPLVAPRYYVALEQRTHLLEPGDLAFIGLPDVSVARRALHEAAARYAGGAATVIDVDVPVADEVREAFIEVRSVATRAVVTILELLSPGNKLFGRGRRRYERKRAQVFLTATSLVEIDLLRAGEPMPVLGPSVSGDYRLLVSRGTRRPRAQLYTWTVRQPIPAFPLPLLPEDPEPTVKLGAVLAELYDRARFDLQLDYRMPPVPPLEGDDAAWARDLLAHRSR